MPKASIDEQLDQLDTLDFSSPENAGLDELQKALNNKNNRLVAKAARLCSEHHIYSCSEQLKHVFHYFVDKADKDKGCYAKKAIVKALYELDVIDSEFYTSAIQYRQMEPVWGGSVDTAVEVRCWAAYGLTLSANSRIILQLLELLHDAEAQARLGAVKAIANTNPTHAEILLREKILDGDEDAYVVGECFHQLIAIEPEQSLSFIKPYLDHPQEEWVEYAALAIAEYKDPAAFEVLQEAVETAFYDTKKKYLIKALALHRSKQSVDYLLGRLDEAGKDEIHTIIEALSIYQTNDDLRRQVQNKIDTSQNQAMESAFKEYWQ